MNPPAVAGVERKGKQMRQNRQRVKARFGRETRFEVRPLPPAPFRALQETGLERLKEQLLRERLARTRQVELFAPLRRAANEAAALAWVTNFPLLVFPALFEEMAQAAMLQVRRQARVRDRSRELLAA